MEDVGIFYGTLVYFPAVWSICGHLVYFKVIWYIFPGFGIFYREKSGNPGMDSTYLFRPHSFLRLILGLAKSQESDVHLSESDFESKFHVK
jgi:hypothetical protein